MSEIKHILNTYKQDIIRYKTHEYQPWIVYRHHHKSSRLCIVIQEFHCPQQLLLVVDGTFLASFLLPPLHVA